MVSISANQTVAANAQEHSLEEKRKSAIKDAFFSEYIDMLDIYLPVVALSPVLFYFQPPNLSEGAATILHRSSLSPHYWAALWVHYCSVWWRINWAAAKPLYYSVSGFGVVTFLIALLPGYETLELGSYLLLVLLRFVDGIFFGWPYRRNAAGHRVCQKRETRFCRRFYHRRFPRRLCQVSTLLRC